MAGKKKAAVDNRGIERQVWELAEPRAASCGCELVSAALDEADPITQAYDLEVSSPGVERPLKRPEDFRRFAGSEVVVKLYAAQNGAKEFSGRLLERDETGLRLATAAGELLFPLEQIARVHLKADF